MITYSEHEAQVVEPQRLERFEELVYKFYGFYNFYRLGREEWYRMSSTERKHSTQSRSSAG